MWLHSLKVAQLLRSAGCLHTNQSRSYLNHLVFYRQTTSRRADDFVATDVSPCSVELNAVLQKILCVISKTCRRTADTLFQSYVQQTEHWGYEVGISKKSPCAVCFSFLSNVICVFV